MELIAKENKSKEYATKDWCNLIAWLINADNTKIGFVNDKWTHEMVWSSNSHGELFAVYDCIGCVKRIIEKKATTERFTGVMIDVLQGKDVPFDGNCSFLGMHCLRTLKRCPDEFNNFVDKMLSL